MMTQSFTKLLNAFSEIADAYLRNRLMTQGLIVTLSLLSKSLEDACSFLYSLLFKRKCQSRETTIPKSLYRSQWDICKHSINCYLNSFYLSESYLILFTGQLWQSEEDYGSLFQNNVLKCIKQNMKDYKETKYINIKIKKKLWYSKICASECIK